MTVDKCFAHLKDPKNNRKQNHCSSLISSQNKDENAITKPVKFIYFPILIKSMGL